MINIAICDDLQSDKQIIINLVNNYCKRNDLDFQVSLFSNGEDLITFCKTKPIDIIFLDIYLLDENGIEIAKELNKLDSVFKLIFTTLSYEHIIESFEVFAFNYLIKPIEEEKFNIVFSKAIATIDKENQKKICIKANNSYSMILHSQILYIESNARKINFYTLDNSVLTCYAKLDKIESDLNNDRFLRCHKSYIVNMDYVQTMDLNSFVLKKGNTIPIKQRNYGVIRKKYIDYISDKLNLDI